MILKNVTEYSPTINDGELVNIWINDLFLSKAGAFKKLIFKNHLLRLQYQTEVTQKKSGLPYNLEFLQRI